MVLAGGGIGYYFKIYKPKHEAPDLEDDYCEYEDGELAVSYTHLDVYKRQLHIQTVDQAAAVKSIKAKVSDIDKMKVEEQKKAARSGYDLSLIHI